MVGTQESTEAEDLTLVPMSIFVDLGVITAAIWYDCVTSEPS